MRDFLLFIRNDLSCLTISEYFGLESLLERREDSEKA